MKNFPFLKKKKASKKTSSSKDEVKTAVRWLGMTEGTTRLTARYRSSNSHTLDSFTFSLLYCRNHRLLPQRLRRRRLLPSLPHNTTTTIINMLLHLPSRLLRPRRKPRLRHRHRFPKDPLVVTANVPTTSFPRRLIWKNSSKRPKFQRQKGMWNLSTKPSKITSSLRL